MPPSKFINVRPPPGVLNPQTGLYDCPVAGCPRTDFSSKDTCATHQRSIHSNLYYRIPRDQYEKEQQLQLDTDCPFCLQVCDGVKSLKDHMTALHKFMPDSQSLHSCAICESAWSSSANPPTHPHTSLTCPGQVHESDHRLLLISDVNNDFRWSKDVGRFIRKSRTLHVIEELIGYLRLGTSSLAGRTARLTNGDEVLEELEGNHHQNADHSLAQSGICPFCKEVCGNPDALARHVMSWHVVLEGPGTRDCAQCHSAWGSNESVSSGTPHNATKCPGKFVSRQGIRLAKKLDEGFHWAKHQGRWNRSAYTDKAILSFISNYHLRVSPWASHQVDAALSLGSSHRLGYRKPFIYGV